MPEFPEEATVYLTRWVLTRGILVTEGYLVHAHQGIRRVRYFVPSPYRKHDVQVTLGLDCFLSLEEARVAAQGAFEKHAKQAEGAVARAKQALGLLAEGKLQVHHDYDRDNFASLRAFLGVEPEEEDGPEHGN
jgi:hypothetical protein